MPARSTETPRERYKSDPLTEQERHDLPIKKAQALAMGEPIIITGARGDALELEVFSGTINTDGDIHLSIRVTGVVKRGSVLAQAKGETITIRVPANIVKGEDP
jgi:hypothetical protein